MDPNYDLEELSYSLQLCEPFSVSDINPSMKSIAHDISSTEILSGALNSVSLVEISGQRDDKENGKFRLDDIVGMKFHDHICSSPPRRSARVTLSNRKNISRKTAKECGKQVIENELLDSISRVGKKARSCNCRPARSSVWGSVGISKYFQKSASVFIKNGSKKSQKGWVTRGSGKGKSDQVATGLQVSNGNSSASLGRIRIKVNLGKEMGQTCSTDMVSATENVPIYVEATGTRTRKLTNFNGDNSNEEVLKVKDTHCCDEDLEKLVTSSELLDTFPTEELKSSETDRKLDGFAADSHQGISFSVDVEEPGVSVDNKYLDLGTSPDSEVINVIPEAQVNGKESEDFHDVQISSQTCVAAADIASLNLPSRRRKKGRKSENMPSACSIHDQDILDRPRVLDNVSVVEKCGQEERPRDGIEFTEAFGLASTANLSSNTSSSEVAPGELLPSSMAGDIENVSPCTKSKGLKHLKSSTSKKGSKVGSEMFESPCSQSGNAYKQKRNIAKSVGKKKVKDKAACGEFARTIKDYHEAGYDSLDGYGKVKTGDENAAQEKNDMDVARETTQPNIDVEVKHTDQCMPTRNAWVLCDECSKWRRIPAILADSIDETNSRWTCKENVDKDFADCSIPQEKSNSEINAELEISDGEDAFIDGSNPKGSQLHPLEGHERSSWKLIKSNKFMHRSRKSQTIDEIMVCHCKPPSNGKLGCGDGCLNRMLNIECVRGTCPCGENCSNQQFQKRKYAKLKWFRCGKKGYGLQLQEDISEGQFLIEYIGEVLDMQAYEARQKDYASQCHKHFYFMTLNGSEVIDACAKGNLGRFINHSCDPNCRTEKWMVNGEVCVGLFALKDLKKGEEVTFDYNYVRVFGAAAKRCVCGSSHCRGYIGGDPRNSEVVVQGDSDDEFPEPVMVYDDGEIDDLKRLISTTSTSDDAKTLIANMEQVLTCEDKLERAETIVEHLEGTEELRLGDVLVNEDNKADKSANDVHHVEAICKNSRSKKLQIAFEVMEKPVKALQPLIQKVKSPLQSDIDSVGTISDPREVIFSSPEASALKEVKKKTVSDSSDTKKKHKLDKIDDKRAPKSKTLVQTSRLSTSIKKGKSSITNSGTLNKPESMVSKSPGLSYKPKKIIGGSATGRFEVEEKLNEVLDVDGGISKRQDAAQGYLKLLFLTAASGDSVGGEAYQSNRDLSMILGAIWKTKSRSVLVDVISKNGLQMLHNILKRCRRAFNRIPILRKLLKVLEFLATKEILTVELINKDPSHEGVESFRESILSLAEHDDKQVHQIARNFRDRWIPRSLRRKNGFHRGFIGNRHPSHNHCQERNSQTRDTVNDNKQSSPADVPVAVDTVMNEGCSSSSCNSVYPSIGNQTRKRKSRWDQPADSNKEQKFQPGFDNTCTTVKDGCLKIRADDEGANMDEDVPPGFAPPRNASSINLANGFSCKVELGHPQGKFMNRLTVSYGIPMPIVQQLGYPKTDGLEDWFIAPGVPFQPYPLLPTCTRNRYDDTRGYKGNRQPDHNPPSTSGFVPSDVEIQGANNCDSFQKAGSSHGVGRYFRQQKWNNARLPPPWKRKENGRVFMGNSSRNRMWGNRNGIEGGNMDIYPNSFTHNPQQEGYH